MGARRFFAIGPFRLDPVDRLLLRDGRPVALTPKAVQTLLVLVERRGRLVTKEELFRAVWPDAFVEENNLAQHISTLRKALGDGLPDTAVIETVPRRGYRFVGPVAEEAEEAAPAPVLPAAGPGRDGGTATATALWPLRRAAIWGLAIVVPVTLMLLTAWRPGHSTPADKTPGRLTASLSHTIAPGLARVAVLPFLNLGPAADDYFAAGMTEEITSRLAGLSRLAVPSTSTMTKYDRKGKSLARVGADLGVDYIVEGSARWIPGSPPSRVRITPKLVRAADDTTIWTHTYETALTDLSATHADIAFQITSALKVVLESGERRSIESPPTSDTDAYLAYLRGIAAFQQGRWDTASQSLARSSLEEAVSRDPGFALAWSWLSSVYATQYRSGAARTPETKQLAHRAARKAIELAPNRPETHLGLAQLLATERDTPGTRRELELSAVGLPNSPIRLLLLAAIDQREGRWAESQAALERAFDLDPAESTEPLAIHFLHLRRYADARRFVDLAMAANRSGVVVPDAWTRFSERGDVAAARPGLEKALAARSPADARVRGLLARLEWFDGRHERALQLISEMDEAGSWMPANFRYPAPLAAAQVYESMGRRTEAKANYAAAMASLQQRQHVIRDDYQVEAAMGLAAAGLGREAEALRHAQRAVQLLPITTDAGEGPLYLYLLAQVQARVGRPTEAIATLDRMFAVPGFYNESWVLREPGLSAVRKHPDFRAHLERWTSMKGDALLARAR